MKILAIDPGETTGMARITVRKDGTIGIMTETTPMWDGIDWIIDQWIPDVVVMENFRPFPHTAKSMIGHTLFTVQVIGVVKYLAARGEATLVLQEPSCAHAIYDLPEWISDLIRVSLNHERMALLHGLYYAQREGII